MLDLRRRGNPTTRVSFPASVVRAVTYPIAVPFDCPMIRLNLSIALRVVRRSSYVGEVDGPIVLTDFTMAFLPIKIHGRGYQGDPSIHLDFPKFFF
jgi:hypothetical protein